jgi:hypothetical protein
MQKLTLNRLLNLTATADSELILFDLPIRLMMQESKLPTPRFVA